MNTYKQHKLNSVGEWITDENDIEQCFKTIFGTEKGKVPHCPNFGLSLLKYIDKPLPQMANTLKAELIKELNLQEPRAKTTKIELTTIKNAPYKLAIKHYYKIINTDITKTVERLV